MAATAILVFLLYEVNCKEQYFFFGPPGIYSINDIENSSDILSLVLYADHTNAFHSNKCLQTLPNTMQEEMNKETKWLNANKLSINTSKTKFIIFESKTKKYKTKINLKINNNIIQQAAFVKFF